MRRVAVTGIGVVSALGINAEQFWKSLALGRTGIRPIKSLDVTRFKIPNGAEAGLFDPLAHLDAKSAGMLDRSTQLASAAAEEAIATSGLRVDGDRTAVVTGCSLGGKISEDEAYRRLYSEGRERFEPMTIPRVMANASASWISMRHRITGPCYTVSTACASAAHAIGQAFWMVRNGLVEAAITGGTEAPFTPGLLRGWEAMRVVSATTCRPFSKDRDGLILGEGAAMFVLELFESAQARGAKIYAEICGFGMTSDAGHLTMPSALGAAAAMRSALADGCFDPSDIGYINAHGTGTDANDRTEAEAIRSVFRRTPPVSSTKSMHGHALGASPALEAAATIFALHNGMLPPTANYTTPDPECNLDVIANEPRDIKALAAISNSFAFGGLNAVLAFRKAG